MKAETRSRALEEGTADRTPELRSQDKRVLGLLERLEAAHGPIDPRVMAEVSRAWSTPGRLRRADQSARE